MPDSLRHTPLHQLQIMLGLASWRLRRDIVRDARRQSAPPFSPPPSAEIAQNHTAESAGAIPLAPETGTIAPQLSAEAQDVGQALEVASPQWLEAGRCRVQASSLLTVLVIEKYGSWWLPPLSLTPNGAHLFRTTAEMDMLQALFAATGLQDLAAVFRDTDAFLSSHGDLQNPLPPKAEDLLSLPVPWVLCGAIAEKQRETLDAGQTSFALTHPLALLKQPRLKRNAWQQILAYRKMLHDENP